MRALPFVAALVVLVAPLPARAEKPAVDAVTIATPRGVMLAANVHRPTVAPATVAVVLAPGQGYHRELPLLKRSAEALAAAGIVAVRYDWGYYTAKGKPSEDLAVEREDVEAVLAHAKAIPGVKRVVLAGKSLGSLVALGRAAEKADDLAGLALLTFPIHDPEDPAQPYPGSDKLVDLDAPTLILHGDRDSLGSLKAMYALCARASRPPSLVIVPGDHGLATTKGDAVTTGENVDVAVAALVLWVRRLG